VITFETTALRFERDDPKDRFDLLLGVCAELTVRVDNRVLYEEPDFPVVELALQLAGWSRTGLQDHTDFEFESMESDEPGLIWFRAADNGYRIGSLYQDFPAMTIWDCDRVRQVVEGFVTELQRRCREELQIDVTPLLDSGAT
jgi:hypothetical protein